MIDSGGIGVQGDEDVLDEELVRKNRHKVWVIVIAKTSLLALS